MKGVYPSNFESKIGFDKIRELLYEKCLSSLGRDIVENEGFSVEHEEVVRRLEETVEFMDILRKGISFPASFYFDMRPSLQRIKIEGAFFEIQELFDFKRSLETLKAVISFFNEREEEEFIRLKEVVKDMQAFPFIYDRLNQIISKHGKIKDSASPNLSKIRRDILSKQSGLSRTIQGILRKSQASGLVERGVSVSIRDGRAVIPIASSNKRKLKGIVHDESASGQTSYIEPAEVVEINNCIRELESLEKREINKIVIAFTDDVRPYAGELSFSYIVLAQLDFIRAKASLSIQMDSVNPHVSSTPELEWDEARHPLLERALAGEKRKIVPLCISLNKEGRILLISGPNAGGKSVCLKTVGLLQYMLQCGIPVPMSEDSRAGIFDKIFVDIGDDQSMENDLSTYSSHLLSMKFFIKNCSPQTLILIDEFGTGTEPMLGGAISESILNHMNLSGTYGVITTHYTNLKHFASLAEGIENGAMLYDVHKMEPMFQLEIGKPGSSFAFEIARKIGLSEDILKEATGKVGKDHIHFDRHLRDIIRDKRYWELKRKQIKGAERHFDKLSEQYERGLKDISEMRERILEKARREANEILLSSNRIIENTIREIKESKAEKERTRSTREKLNKFKESISEEPFEEEGEVRRKMKKIRKEKGRRGKRLPDDKQQETAKPARVGKGDMVRVKEGEVIGEVVEIKGKSAVVAFGQLKSVVKHDDLEWVSNNRARRRDKSRIKRHGDTVNRQVAFNSSIDVRGMRADEALPKIQSLIDSAVISDAEELRILHGKGSGALRESIRDYLNTEPVVKHFRDEDVRQGGSGITVVTLR